MWSEIEALEILKQNQIPFHQGVKGIPAVIIESEIEVDRLRRLGFRVSHGISGQWVVSFRGKRLALIV